MVEDKQDTIVRAYARLSALRKNIGEMTTYSVEETYVGEFHTVLDRLEAIGMAISEFRVPDSVMQPRVTSISFEGTHYSEEKYVDKAYLLAKIDAILAYFEITMSEKPRSIGFRMPDK